MGGTYRLADFTIRKQKSQLFSQGHPRLSASGSFSGAFQFLPESSLEKGEPGGFSENDKDWVGIQGSCLQFLCFLSSPLPVHVCSRIQSLRDFISLQAKHLLFGCVVEGAGTVVGGVGKQPRASDYSLLTMSQSCEFQAPPPLLSVLRRLGCDPPTFLQVSTPPVTHPHTSPPPAYHHCHFSPVSRLLHWSFWLYTFSNITLISEESGDKHLGLKCVLLSCLPCEQKIRPNLFPLSFFFFKEIVYLLKYYLSHSC